jgi:hypothetical protein
MSDPELFTRKLKLMDAAWADVAAKSEPTTTGNA